MSESGAPARGTRGAAGREVAFFSRGLWGVRRLWRRRTPSHRGRVATEPFTCGMIRRADADTPTLHSPAGIILSTISNGGGGGCGPAPGSSHGRLLVAVRSRHAGHDSPDAQTCTSLRRDTHTNMGRAVNIYIRDEELALWERVEAYARKRRMPLSGLVLEAMEEHLARHAEDPPKE
jgi:hypothetical protein